jgi:hypothetical protein
VRIAYADPPYPGCAHLYKDHSDYGGEVDHKALVSRLFEEFDGFVLHTSSPALPEVLRYFPLAPVKGKPTWRTMAWVKPFAAFKRNVPVAYAWEPVIVQPCRKPVVTGRCVMRDWVSEPITMKRGLTGAKPFTVCEWAFEVVGAEPTDELVDLFPGTGAVTRAWESWRSSLLVQTLTPPAPEPEERADEDEIEAMPGRDFFVHTRTCQGFCDYGCGVFVCGECGGEWDGRPAQHDCCTGLAPGKGTT